MRDSGKRRRLVNGNSFLARVLTSPISLEDFRARKFGVTFCERLAGIECPVAFGPLCLAVSTEPDPKSARSLPNDPFRSISAVNSFLSFSGRRPVHSVRRRCFFIWYFCVHGIVVVWVLVADSISEQNLCQSLTVTAGQTFSGVKAATKRILIAGS
jgi:hypothetical protein